MTDADLVARVRTGDHAAFGELVDRHRTAVYRAAMAALRSPAEADDAAQDAFVSAWRRLESFRGEASFRTWLLAIAWHEALNRRRGLKKWWQRTVSLDGDVLSDGSRTAGIAHGVGVGTGWRSPAPGADSRNGPHAQSPTGERGVNGVHRTRTAAAADVYQASGPTPEQAASSVELQRDIALAIQSLTPKLRDALLLAQSGDYTYEEIGAMVRAPVGTIKWRVSEARRLVKQQLQKRGHVQLG